MNASDAIPAQLNKVNKSGTTYVAYLFAHNPAPDGIIQSGSFTTDVNGNADIPIGWEPQCLIFKRISSAGAWAIIDNLRGFNAGGTTAFISPNVTDLESTVTDIRPTATGFSSHGYLNPSTVYSYVAIRRSTKPPATGGKVYNAIARSGSAAVAEVTVAVSGGFSPDICLCATRTSTPTINYSPSVISKLRGPDKNLQIGGTNGTLGEVVSLNSLTNFRPLGFSVGTDSTLKNINGASATFINWLFKRTVTVLDEICYDGVSMPKAEAHGLGAVPELIFFKARHNAGVDWAVYCNALGLNNTLFLNKSDAVTVVNIQTDYPTGDTLRLANHETVNGVDEYVAYLFASRPGISKIGSYVGNGGTQSINCGFTTGARFILIKRTDAAGYWHIWDTVRGIVAGNDPHFSLNGAAAEVTTDDSIGPNTSGFIVNQNLETNINVASATYIFLAFS